MIAKVFELIESEEEKQMSDDNIIFENDAETPKPLTEEEKKAQAKHRSWIVQKHFVKELFLLLSKYDVSEDYAHKFTNICAEMTQKLEDRYSKK